MMRFPSSVLAFLWLQGSPAEATTAALPEIVQWGAIGSGCHSRPEKESDVILTKPEKWSGSGELNYVFTLRAHELRGDKPVLATVPSFGRECSIRIVLKPPAGMRIKSVDSHMRVRVEKDKGASLKVAMKLHTPRADLGSKMLEFGPGEELKAHEESLWVFPANGGKGADIASGCNEGRILGVDVIFQNERRSFTEKVSGAMAGDGAVNLSVFLERCSN